MRKLENSETIFKFHDLVRDSSSPKQQQSMALLTDQSKMEGLVCVFCPFGLALETVFRFFFLVLPKTHIVVNIDEFQRPPSLFTF